MPRNRRGGRGSGEGKRALAEATRGQWDNMTMRRDARTAERIGGKARIGGGLTNRDISRAATLRAEERSGEAARRRWELGI